MHVGMAAVFQNPGPASPDLQVYRDELRLAELAEPLGFQSIWGVERNMRLFAARVLPALQKAG